MGGPLPKHLIFHPDGVTNSHIQILANFSKLPFSYWALSSRIQMDLRQQSAEEVRQLPFLPLNLYQCFEFNSIVLLNQHAYFRQLSIPRYFNLVSVDVLASAVYFVKSYQVEVLSVEGIFLQVEQDSFQRLEEVV